MSFLKSIFTKDKKERLDKGLSISKKSFFSKLGTAIAGKSKVDELVLDELEEVLIRSDVGVATTIKIIQALENRVAKDKYINTSELNNFLEEEIASLMKENSISLASVDGPYVIMVVGVNGVGKTTTIGKLASKFKKEGKKVVLGGPSCLAGDVIGEYYFIKNPNIGDKVVFLDQAHYTLVKTNFFNGINHPEVVLWNSDNNDFKIIKSFDFKDFETRN